MDPMECNMLVKLSDTKFVACSSIDEIEIDYHNNKIVIILNNNREIHVQPFDQMSLSETFDCISKQINANN